MWVSLIYDRINLGGESNQFANFNFDWHPTNQLSNYDRQQKCLLPIGGVCLSPTRPLRWSTDVCKKIKVVFCNVVPSQFVTCSKVITILKFGEVLMCLEVAQHDKTYDCIGLWAMASNFD